MKQTKLPMICHPLFVLLLALSMASAANASTLEWKSEDRRMIAGKLAIGGVEGTGVSLADFSFRPDGFVNGIRLIDSDFKVVGHIMVTDPMSHPLVSIHLSATMKPGTFNIEKAKGLYKGLPAPGMQVGVDGHMRMCLYFPFGCTIYLDIPLGTTAGAGIGMGGIIAVQGGGFGLSLQGAPWTIGAVPFTDVTANGGVWTNVRGGAVDPVDLNNPGLSAAVGGVVSLVSKTIITRMGGVQTPEEGQRATYFRFRVISVPEPTEGILLLSGVGGLIVLGWRRRHA